MSLGFWILVDLYLVVDVCVTLASFVPKGAPDNVKTIVPFVPRGGAECFCILTGACLFRICFFCLCDSLFMFFLFAVMY